MRNSRLVQKVNFSLSMVCIGAFALLGVVLMLQAAELENPIAAHLSAIQQELERDER